MASNEHRCHTESKNMPSNQAVMHTFIAQTSAHIDPRRKRVETVISLIREAFDDFDLFHPQNPVTSNSSLHARLLWLGNRTATTLS